MLWSTSSKPDRTSSYTVFTMLRGEGREAMAEIAEAGREERRTSAVEVGVAGEEEGRPRAQPATHPQEIIERSALSTTEMDDALMAKAANIGLIRIPKTG